jgi:alpha-L-fucosidase
MKISRRKALSVIAGAPALLLARKSLAAQAATAGTAVPTPAPAPPMQLEIAPGPFKGTRESLREWQVPEWYRDAKFGIWAHWGPQSGVEYGD